MGGEYPKGMGGGRYSWGIRPSGGAIFLGIPPPFERGRISWGGDKSPVTTAWANSSTFLKILSCPPPNMSLPLKCPPPPNSEAWHRHCRSYGNCLILTGILCIFKPITALKSL